MRKPQSLWAAVQIGIGIILVLTSVIVFIRATHYELAMQNLFLGAGLLLYGLADNNKDKSEKGKFYTYIGAVFLIIGSILVIYYSFLSSK